MAALAMVPNEILDLILSNLPSATVSSMARVSKSMSLSTTCILYRKIRLSSITRAIYLLRAFFVNPTLREYVRWLSFDFERHTTKAGCKC
jgi:hypothetical protein